MAIFTVFQPGDITKVKATEVTAGLWSPDETGSLGAIYSSSVQIGISGVYYYDMYDSPTAATQEVQFSVAYGHRLGSGSPQLSDLPTSLLPTKVIYSQYRNILLGSGSKFSFDGVESEDIYVININRARLKQSLDPGNWSLGLSGSNGIRTFTDDSALDVSVTGNVIASQTYNIRSGSIGNLAADTTVYGTVFPDYGVIILYPAAISSSVGFVNPVLNGRTATAFPFAPFTGAVGASYQYAHEGLVRSISGSMARGVPFIARSLEQVTSQNYFVRLRNDQYNYTNNPSYYTTVDGVREVLGVFEEKPLTYPTTIGLYNGFNEMLGVAKLSRPIQKSEDKEALIRIRLDY